RSDPDAQVLFLEPERVRHLADLLLESHQRNSDALDLVIGQRAALHPPDRLPLQHLTQELDEPEHQTREAAFHIVRVDIDALRKRSADARELGADLVELDAQLGRVHDANEYGGIGPLTIASTLSSCPSNATTRSRSSRTSSRSINTATIAATPSRGQIL